MLDIGFEAHTRLDAQSRTVQRTLLKFFRHLHTVSFSVILNTNQCLMYTASCNTVLDSSCKRLAIYLTHNLGRFLKSDAFFRNFK